MRCEILQRFLEHVTGGTVAAAAIAQQQQRLRLRILELTNVQPPLPDAVAGKFTGVMAGAEVEIAGVAFEVVQAIGDDDAGAETGEIVIPNQLGLLHVELAVAIEKA